MGRTWEETERLRKQSRLYNSATRRLFEEAGIAPGMKVLDVGSGAGDVALLAADFVGPSGIVVGVDTNPTILETARERTREAGLTQVSFIAGDIRSVVLAHDFDAVVGRVALIYLNDPAAVLRELVSHLRPGGIVAFQEIDWSSGPIAQPPSSLLVQVWRWVPEMFRRAGLNPHIGLNLHQIFLIDGYSFSRFQSVVDIGGGSGRLLCDILGANPALRGTLFDLPHVVADAPPLVAAAGVADRCRIVGGSFFDMVLHLVSELLMQR